MTIAPRSFSRRSEHRIEEELASLSREGTEEGDERIEPGDPDSEGLYQDELDAGRIQDLNARLAAVDRAEARVAAGTYGVSTISGERDPRRETRSAAGGRADRRGGGKATTAGIAAAGYCS